MTIDPRKIAARYKAALSFVSKSKDFLQTWRTAVTKMRPTELGEAVGRVPPLDSWVELGRKFKGCDLQFPEELDEKLPELVCSGLRFPVIIAKAKEIPEIKTTKCRRCYEFVIFEKFGCHSKDTMTRGIQQSAGTIGYKFQLGIQVDLPK